MCRREREEYPGSWRLMRVHKWFSRLGVASRRETERWIHQGRVQINGEVCALGEVCDPVRDCITLDGKPLMPLEQSAYTAVAMLYKPRKVLVSRRSQGHKRTIYELASVRTWCQQLFERRGGDGGQNTGPGKESEGVEKEGEGVEKSRGDDKGPVLSWIPAVGRLDYESEGLLLLTYDGDLNYRLTHPGFCLPKTYDVALHQPLSEASLSAMNTTGVLLEDGWVSDLTVVAVPSIKGPPWRVQMQRHKRWWYRVTVMEGRNRLLRRIFACHQRQVLALVRVQIGELHLSHHLLPGALQELDEDQKAQLTHSSHGVTAS